jgi:hypothetical protein
MPKETNELEHNSGSTFLRMFSLRLSVPISLRFRLSLTPSIRASPVASRFPYSIMDSVYL